jgi:hypothetical protein
MKKPKSKKENLLIFFELNDGLQRAVPLAGAAGHFKRHKKKKSMTSLTDNAI